MDRLTNRVAYRHRSRESSLDRPQQQLEEFTLSPDYLEKAGQNFKKKQFMAHEKAYLDKENQKHSNRIITI